MSDLIISTFLYSLCLLPLTIGVFFSYRILSIPDITTDGSFVLGACSGWFCQHLGLPPLISILISFSSCFLSGVITGFIHVKFEVSALLSGILVMTALYSVNLILLGQPNQMLLSESGLLGDPAQINESCWPALTLLFLGVLIVAGLIWILNSDWGLAMQATGLNEAASKALGIPTGNFKILGLGVSNGLVGLSGFLILQLQGFVDVNMGIGIIVTGFAAVMIAEKIRPGIWKNHFPAELFLLWLAVLLYRSVITLSMISGVPSEYMKLITSIMVFSFILFSHRKKTI